MDLALLAHLREAPHLQKAILDHYASHVPRSTVQHRLYYLVRLGYLTTTWRGRRLQYEAVTEALRGEAPAGVPVTVAGSVS